MDKRHIVGQIAETGQNVVHGQQLEKELREEVEIQRQSGPKNLLELLQDEFTKEQYRQMRQSQGKTGDGENTLRT